MISSSREAQAPLRWSDVSLVPLTGKVATGGTISVVWENYEIGKRKGDAMCHVTMSLVRDRTSGGRMAMQILSDITESIRSSHTQIQLRIDYDCAVPFADALVDNLAFSFGETPPGGYALTIAVTDEVSGRTTSRSTRVVIGE